MSSQADYNDFLSATNYTGKGGDTNAIGSTTPPKPTPEKSRPAGNYERIAKDTDISLVNRPPDSLMFAQEIMGEYAASKAVSCSASETDGVNTNDPDTVPKYSENDVLELLRRQHSLLTVHYDEKMRTIAGSTMKYYLKETRLDSIIPHEEILPERVDQFYDYIMSYGINNPICIPAIIVDITTNVIIDGHHRYYTLRKLGLQEVEVLFIDYFHEDIKVETKAKIDKDAIVAAARSGKLLRPKLTRHLVLQNGKYVPLLCISAIISFVLKIVLSQI